MLKQIILTATLLFPSISIACDEHAGHGATTSYAKVDVISSPKKGNDGVSIRLSENATGKPIGYNDLKEVHTKRLHVMLVDPTLTDYKHIHPSPAKTKGVYRFDLSPTKAGYYRAFADITPVATDKQEYVPFVIGRENKMLPRIDKTASYGTMQDGYNFKLEFENELKAGEDNMGKVTVTKDGKEFTDFEEVMGAYTHIAAFSNDGRKLEHIHNMEGRELKFHLPAQKPGFVKIFVQVKIGGKDIYAPFGLVIN